VSEKILLVGGYGNVGQWLAADLAPRYVGRVIVAGRDRLKAEALARRIGHGAAAIACDVEDPRSVATALEGVSVAVACVGQHGRHVLKAAIGRGLAYTDIAPALAMGGGVDLDAMHAGAAATGARVVLGAGLSPGLTSVMARAAAARVGVVHCVRSAVLLSIGDTYGPDASAWIAQELMQRFEVMRGGVRRTVRAFSEPWAMDFGASLGLRTTYLFPFSDQVFYARTLGAPTTESPLALDPPWVARLARMLVRVAGDRLSRGEARSRPTLQRVIALLKRAYRGSDAWGVSVEVDGARGRYRATAAGRTESVATALAAAGIVDALAAGEVRAPGVWLAEQVIDSAQYFARLAQRGVIVSETFST
jgi:saccharopine dehydrogenase (NAD+, L-lysine forming)